MINTTTATKTTTTSNKNNNATKTIMVQRKVKLSWSAFAMAVLLGLAFLSMPIHATTDSDDNDDSSSDMARGPTWEIVETEVSLGIDPRDNLQAETTIDIYNYAPVYPSASGQMEAKDYQSPLAVMMCGGNVPKSAYRTFARGLARRGLVVAVVEHNVTFGPFATPGNFASPLDISNTILHMESHSNDFNLDMSQVVLLGHSFGTAMVLNAINNLCPFPFCVDATSPFPAGIHVPLHTGVVLAGGYGSSLADPQTDTFVTYNNNHIPFAIINGDGDVSYFLDSEGENRFVGSFVRMAAPKAAAGIKNLDHFSISEVVTNTNRGDVLSTLPRRKQIRIVTRAMFRWIKVGLKAISKNKPIKKFCQKLENNALKRGYELDQCLEEYL